MTLVVISDEGFRSEEKHDAPSLLIKKKIAPDDEALILKDP